MHRYLASVCAVALTLMLSDASLAQTYRDSGGSVVQGMVPVGGDRSGPLFTPNNPGNVTGTLSASFSGFQPTPNYSYQSVTTTSAVYALPTGTVVIFYNTGSTAITVKLGSSSVSVTSGQADVIQPGSWMAFTVGGATYYAVVGNGGTSSVVASGGAGLPTGAGGGGSGGGGGTMTQGSPNTVANAWPFAPVVAGSAVSSTKSASDPGRQRGDSRPRCRNLLANDAARLASVPPGALRRLERDRRSDRERNVDNGPYLVAFLWFRQRVGYDQRHADNLRNCHSKRWDELEHV